MKDYKNEIIKYLPYGEGFRFVDSIDFVDNEIIKGTYFFAESSIYTGQHFVDETLVPGVLLLECMGQIGLVAHGIYLLNLQNRKFFPALSHVEVNFYEAVNPNTNVQVVSRKIYLRTNILKSQIKLLNSKNEALIAYSEAICKFVAR